MEESFAYKDYYRNYLLSAVYSHEEQKIYSALRAISNLKLVEIIPLLDLVILNDSLNPDIKMFAEEIKKDLMSNTVVS